MCVCHPSQYLGLRQAQFGCQVGPLGQGEVLGLLEALVKCLELQAGVNGPRLPDLLPLPVQPHLPVLYHRRGLLVFWREEDFPKIIINTGTSCQVLQDQSQCFILHVHQEDFETLASKCCGREIFFYQRTTAALPFNVFYLFGFLSFLFLNLVFCFNLFYFLIFFKGKLVVAFCAVSSSCFFFLILNFFSY